MSRNATRNTYQAPVRLSLLENDLDQKDDEIHELAVAVKELDATVRERLTKILWAVVTLSFSFAAATISFTLAVIAR